MKSLVRTLNLPQKTPLIILSPHLDDAIWSIGGLLRELADNGFEIHVVTLFSQTVFVYGGLRPPVEATYIRKGEDLHAAHTVGIRNMTYLDFPDGLLRDTPLDGVLNSSYQTPAYLLEAIIAALHEQLPPQATLLAPLALGGHMDHLTTRRAATALNRPLIFFEDLPYAARPHDTKEEDTFKVERHLQAVRQPLNDIQITEHLKFYEMYPSQRADIDADQIKTYLQVNGYALWQ